MSTLAPDIVAIGGIEEVALATWGSAVLHVLRRGVGIFLHRSDEDISVQLLLPCGASPKKRIACLVLGDELLIAWSSAGNVELFKWDLLREKVVLPTFQIGPGESPSLAIYRTSKLLLGYARNDANRHRISLTAGETWSSEFLDDSGNGPLAEVDVASADDAGSVVKWIETDGVSSPVEVHAYSMDLADISGVTLTDSIGGQNGTLLNGVTTGVAGAVSGEALQFDGVDDEVTIDGVTFDLASDYTVSVYVKVLSFPGSTKAILDSRTGSFSRPFSLLAQPYGLTFEVEGQSGNTHTIAVSGTGPDVLGVWVRVDLTYNATLRIMKGYLNGVLRAASGITSTNVSSTLFRVGASPTLGGANFTGFVDRLRIWNRVLTATQIAALT
jgi:hypothetical protein